MFNIPKTLQKALIIPVVIVSFIGGYCFRDWTKENTQFTVVSVNTQKSITSAITDRWELQLTDRKTGKVRIYDREVLNAIYYQYRARLSYTQEDKIPRGE